MMARVRQLFAEIDALARIDPDYRPDSKYDLVVLFVLLINLAMLVGGHLL